MELKFKKLPLFLLVIFSASFYGFSSPHEAADSTPSAPTADALAMLEERFASLSGSMGKMTAIPKLSGTLSLPSEIKGNINLPGDGIVAPQTSKENES